MECKDFQKLINDFIFDKIEYSEDLKEFLNHAKTCKNCGEELELYYNIINFYDEYFEKQRKRKKAAIISVIIAMLMIIFVIVCLYLNTIGII